MRRWIATPSGRRKWDAFKLRPPVFGPLAHKVALARFCTTFSSLLSAGVPVIEALDIVSANAGNQIVADALVGAQDGRPRRQERYRPCSRNIRSCPSWLRR